MICDGLIVKKIQSLKEFLVWLVQPVIFVFICLLSTQALALATITSTVAAGAGPYHIGQTVAITVTFSEAVTSTGASTMTLAGTTGSPSASCPAVTSSTTLLCNYTVLSGESASPLVASSLTGTVTTDSDSLAANLTFAGTLLAASSTVIDGIAPTVLPAGIQVNNSVSPQTITLTFSEAMTNNAALTTTSNYTVTNNSAAITYNIASAVRTSATVVTLTLATQSAASTATYITNADITAGLKVTVANIADLNGNTASASAVTESGSAHTRDLTAPTLPAASIAVTNNVQPNTIRLTFNKPLTISASGGGDVTKYIVTNSTGTITYSLVSAVQSSTLTTGIVTLTLATADPNNTATYLTNADIAAHIKVTVAAGLTDLAGNAYSPGTVTEAGATHTLDAVLPNLTAANIQVNNSVQPNKVILTFSEPLTVTNASDVTKYTVTNNAASLSYRLATAVQSAGNVVTLTFQAADPTLTTTYMTNADIAAHIKVGLLTGQSDLAGNALTAATVAENAPGSSIVTDTTAPTVVAALAYVDSTHVRLTFSEKVNKTKAETLANYTIAGTGNGAVLAGTPTAAALGSNGVDVTLTIGSMNNLRPTNTVTVTAGTAITDLAGNAISTSATATLTASNAPTAFTFGSVTNALLKTNTPSAAVTITGINVPAAISVVAGSDPSLQCSIAPAATGVFGAFTACNPATPLVVGSGDQLQVQLMSASTSSTTVSGGISIAGVSSTFTVRTAAGTPVPSGVTYTALTAGASVSSVILSPDAAITVSSNGVVVVPQTVTGVVTVTPSAPANTAFSVQLGGNIQFNVGGNSVAFQPAGGDALLVLKSYTIDGVAGIPVLELAAGRAVVSAGGGLSPIFSLQLGAGSTAKQMLMTGNGINPVAVDVQHTTDGGAIIALSAGRLALRLDSGASTLVVADAPGFLYSNEVATLSAAGKPTLIRVGSLSGVGSAPGDALPASVFPANVKSRAKIPNLNPALERIDSSVSLMQGLFDFIGSRTTLTQPTQGSTGLLPLLFDSLPLFLTPYGDVLIDPSRPDGITLASDGHFEVSRNGVYVKLTTTVGSLTTFAQAVQGTYSGTVTLTEDAAFEINNGGKTILVKPQLFTQPSGAFDISIAREDTGLLSLHSSLRTQTLFPHFYDLNQLAITFKSLDPKIALVDNLDGTVTATVGANSLILAPEYEVLSPIGGIPPQYRSVPWWSTSDGVIYMKYPTGAAQGFRVR